MKYYLVWQMLFGTVCDFKVFSEYRMMFYLNYCVDAEHICINRPLKKQKTKSCQDISP